MHATFTPVSPREDLNEFFETAPQLFAQLHEVYKQHGFEAGYARAVRDQLASLVLFTEEFLRHESDVAPTSRQLVYRFVAHLQSQLMRLTPSPRLDRLRSAG